MENRIKVPTLELLEPVEFASGKIGVWLFSGQPLFRLGLRQAFSDNDGLRVVGDSDLKEKRLILLELMTPEVVIVDAESDIRGAVELIKRVYQSVPEARVIMLSDAAPVDNPAGWAKNRAITHAPKSVTPEKIRELVRLTSACPGCESGGINFGSNSASTAARCTRPAPLNGKRGNKLSGREIEIMTAIANGYANKQIACRLGISERTVKNHVTSIFKKLGVNARVEALVKALKTGVITLGEHPA